MSGDFTLPPGLLGRFGVIKLWPDIQVAEDEVIARLVNAAKLLGLECVVLDHMGRRLEEGGEPLTGKELDFVIHLHFSTPKSYDVFSFVTLWNPPQFFHDFGYRPSIENLLTHDDYLSCESPGADLHLRRLIHEDATHLPAEFTLFHSLGTPILPPTIGEGKIFYMGINWERLGQTAGRHQTVLNLLDGTGMLSIYGPEELRGVKVWDGFESYQRSLPFDGTTAIEEIHRAGICLALSSEPHKDTVLMSNRLFEGLAAGALVICDENPWARDHYGDTLLYVDMRDGAEAVAARITEHVRWARSNPEEATALAARAQAIFKRDHRMDASLIRLYEGFPARRDRLAALALAETDATATRILFLAPDPADEAFQRQLHAARDEIARGFGACLLVDRHDLATAHAVVKAEGGGVEIRAADFFQRDSAGAVVRRNRIGAVLKPEFLAAPAGSQILVVSPNEKLYENHVAILSGTLSRHPEAAYAWSKAVQRLEDGRGETVFEVERDLNLLSRDPATPIGWARFLFRADAVREVSELLLESLDMRASSGMAFYAEGQATRRATLMIDARRDRPFLGIAVPEAAQRRLAPELWQDVEAIRDLYPARFDELERVPDLRGEVHQIQRRMQDSSDILHKAFHDLHEAFLDIRGHQQNWQRSSDILHKAFHDLHEAFLDIRSHQQEGRRSSDILHKAFHELHEAFLGMKKDTQETSRGRLSRVVAERLPVSKTLKPALRSMLARLRGPR